MCSLLAADTGPAGAAQPVASMGHHLQEAHRSRTILWAALHEYDVPFKLWLAPHWMCDLQLAAFPPRVQETRQPKATDCEGVADVALPLTGAAVVVAVRLRWASGRQPAAETEHFAQTGHISCTLLWASWHLLSFPGNA
mmetsp:Transcript_98867/g.280066  ORF Transcript_98867/g.280066 Transcript_98867/m.280066 type:complete len:139 (+) Transcript_98867:645-1061(+)